MRQKLLIHDLIKQGMSVMDDELVLQSRSLQESCTCLRGESRARGRPGSRRERRAAGSLRKYLLYN